MPPSTRASKPPWRPAPAPIPCDAQASCNTDASTVLCCSGYCVDTAKDPANCGQCGNGCTANQFCTGVACDDAIIANVCAQSERHGRLRSVRHRTTKRAPRWAPRSRPSASRHQRRAAPAGRGGRPRPRVRPPDHRGGQYVHHGRRALRTGRQRLHGAAGEATPIYLQNNGTNARILTRAGTEIVNERTRPSPRITTTSTCSSPWNPRAERCASPAWGSWGPGSQAAGYYAAAELIPNRANYTASWYVYEWTTTNSDSIANVGDTYTLCEAGP